MIGFWIALPSNLLGASVQSFVNDPNYA